MSSDEGHENENTIDCNLGHRDGGGVGAGDDWFGAVRELGLAPGTWITALDWTTMAKMRVTQAGLFPEPAPRSWLAPHTRFTITGSGVAPE